MLEDDGVAEQQVGGREAGHLVVGVVPRHHADEVFTSWGVETPKKFSQEEIARILEELDSGEYGIILRAKGIIPGKDGKWIHFDHVPGEADIRTGGAGVTGRLCVIGSKLDEQGVARLFGV